jgi:uncharacterized repeat protein (TIGR01451 family)
MSKPRCAFLRLLVVLSLCLSSLAMFGQAKYSFQEVQQDESVKGQVPSRPSAPMPPGQVVYPSTANRQGFAGEIEPNGTFGTATPLATTNTVVRANLFPAGDIDFYSFTATAGDRVYAATMTAFSAGNSTDSQLTLLASDGTTVIEFDDDNGSFAGLSSSIAGATIPTSGTYFLKVNDFTAGTTSERPYELHVRVQSGAPTPEVEGNDTPATANPLPANGWVSGTRNPAAATEQDWYSLNLNAGDTVYLSLDLDPERDTVSWNGRLGFALFGDATNQILVVDDAGTGDVTPNPNIPSEAMFFTVKTAGQYFAFVDSASAAVGGPTATYHLSVSIHPATNEGINCTTYTSTDVPKTIGPGTGLVSSTITVPGNPRIADVDVEIVLNHALMQDIDAHLRSPAGNDNGIFSDIGAAATGGQTQMDIVFDDEAGVPPSFTALKGVAIKPELNYRLSWFDGENAGGVWTLDLRDDTAGANGGTLTSWALRICEAPALVTSCAPGFGPTTVFSTDFESGAAGFTHSGTADEWELGLPATVATTTANPVAGFSTCNSGVNCWKTDLDNTYDVSSTQDLLSAPINLAGLSAPVTVSWAQRFQMESANFDHFLIEAREIANPTNALRLEDYLDATMTDPPGNPTVNVPASSGWSLLSRRIDSLAGLNSELRFNLTSDNTVNFAGLAIDDVTVTACRPLSSDLSVTKTDGVTTATPGGSVTYTITASNAGPDAATGVSLTDTFPAVCTTVSTTSVAAGGATGNTAGPFAGNLNETLSMPAGSSVTYTSTCTIAASATGSLANTANISSSIADPVPANNTATDTDTLAPSADLNVTKTDGVTSATPGGSVVYTITYSNAGPSNAPGTSAADTFPAACTSVSTTSLAAGGATGNTAGPFAGNIADTLNLPAGGSVTYTSTCSISSSATGSLSNTATVAAGAGVTDPVPANNSATDVDTLAPSADLSITKTDGVTSATPGGSVTYTIVVNNTGPSAAVGTNVSDTFPAACTSVSTTSLAAGGATGNTTGPFAGNLNETLSLPVGGSVTYTSTCTISGSASGSLSNTATVAAGAGVTDPNPANNSATDVDAIGASADLSVTKTDGVTTAPAGGSVTYTIVVSNAGPSAAAGTSLTDTFPAACTSVSTTSLAAGGATGNTAGPFAGNINETLSLPSGSSVTYTSTCTISPAAVGSLSNTATVAAGAGVTDPTPGNNSATDTDSISNPPNVSGTKTAAGTFTVGSNVTYTIILTNSGGTAQGDNAGNEFDDVLPAQLALVSASASSGTAVANVGTNTVTWNGSIPAGGSVTITITATILPSAAGTTVNNQGTIHYDSDGNGTNDQNRSTDDPAQGGAANPTPISVPATDTIPALSPLGLLMLSALLAAVALLKFTRAS